VIETGTLSMIAVRMSPAVVGPLNANVPLADSPLATMGAETIP
jgi:hypothetical protein